MSGDLEQRIGSAVTDKTPPDGIEPVSFTHEIVRECGILGYSLQRLSEYVRHIIYEGGGWTPRGSIQYSLKLSERLLDACLHTLAQQDLIVVRQDRKPQYAASWKGLFTWNGIRLRFTEPQIPQNLHPERPRLWT